MLSLFYMSSLVAKRLIYMSCDARVIILTQNGYPSAQLESPAIIVVVFVALRPKSTAMVIAGRSVHLTTLFPGQA